MTFGLAFCGIVATSILGTAPLLSSQEVRLSVSELDAWEQYQRAVLGVVRYPYPFIGHLAGTGVLVGYYGTKEEYSLSCVDPESQPPRKAIGIPSEPVGNRLGCDAQVINCGRTLDIAVLGRSSSPWLALELFTVADLSPFAFEGSRTSTMNIDLRATRFPEACYYAVAALREGTYALFGQLSETRERLSLHPTGYSKTCMLIVGEGIQPQSSMVEKRGAFHVSRAAFAVDDGGQVHSAWIRDRWRNGRTEQTVLYSRTDAPNTWRKPVVLQVIPESGVCRELDLGILATTWGVLVFLADQGQGVGCFTIEGGALRKKEVLAAGSTVPALAEGLRLLYWDRKSPFLAVTEDSRGDVYVLWIANVSAQPGNGNGRGAYSLVLRKMHSRQWDEGESVVAHGDGSAFCPNMFVDDEKTLHVVYLRPTQINKCGVFYRKIRWRDANDE
jgi:hypothetical protein